MRFAGGIFGPSSLGEIVVAETFNPVNPICNLQMKRITFAKNWFATDRGLNMGEECTVSDLEPYLSEETKMSGGWSVFLYQHRNISSVPRMDSPGGGGDRVVVSRNKKSYAF